MEPSAIWGISMEGALLRHGPSVISSLRVEGWFCLHRTVRDSGLKRGGFGSGEWNLPRFRASAWRVPLWRMNLPQFRASAWRVRSWRMEPSAKWSINMEGALLRYEPSTVSGLSADGSANIFAQQLRANTRERGYCRSRL